MIQLDAIDRGQMNPIGWSAKLWNIQTARTALKSLFLERTVAQIAALPEDLRDFAALDRAESVTEPPCLITESFVAPRLVPVLLIKERVTWEELCHAQLALLAKGRSPTAEVIKNFVDPFSKRPFLLDADEIPYSVGPNGRDDKGLSDDLWPCKP